MRSSRLKTGPFDQRLFFTIDEIDRLCVDALKSADLLPWTPQPIRIDRFVEKHFNCPLEYKDLGDGILGCTEFSRKGAVILVAVSDVDEGSHSGERRLRSTIAHEAGHGLMHASLFIEDGHQKQVIGDNIDFERRRILCRPSDVGGAGSKAYDGRWWEWQANRAIGGLLLPKRLVSQSLEGLLEKTSALGVATLSKKSRGAAASVVADTFEVNPAVAQIRLSEMFPEKLENQMML